jgi:hypothetical protein
MIESPTPTESTAAEWAQQGVFNFQTFGPTLVGPREFLVEGLFPARSVNILVGDSNLGKTPLGVTLGVAVSAGIPFLGRRASEGEVLYCDSESQPEQFAEMVRRISLSLDLPEPPEGFKFWSPYWEPAGLPGDAVERMLEHVAVLQPALVVVDPLRTFWPTAEAGPEEAMQLISRLREQRTTWLITHHRRKPARDIRLPHLDEDPHGWMLEAAGSRALVNNTDARLGLEPTTSRANAELVLGGFVRGTGPIAPIYLGREFDEAGMVLGYRALSDLDLLAESYRSAFSRLPSMFRFIDAKQALGGTSNSNASRFLQQCLDYRLVTREESHYVKAGRDDGIRGNRAVAA